MKTVLNRNHVTRNHAIKLALRALFVLTIFASSADAKMGSVRVVFTKAGSR
jgi:hypothetical protein